MNDTDFKKLNSCGILFTLLPNQDEEEILLLFSFAIANCYLLFAINKELYVDYYYYY